jgi:transcription initiation factor TFIID subunit 2
MHRYILAVCANDPSRIVRREVARGIVESVAILEAVGDLRTPGKEGDKPVMIEDDMSQQPNKQKQSKRGEVENFVRTLRKGVGCYSGIRDAVIPMLL